MRLYEFSCKACGKVFEDLVRELADARCPACASSDVEKQMSAFAVGGARSDTSSAGGGGCGGGMCGGGGCGFN